MEIKQSKHLDGKGLFTTKSCKKNEIVFVLEGEIFSEPTRESIYIGNGEHIYDEYGIFINHSFTPNIKIVNKNVVALQDIESDTEVVFNYNDSELKMANPFYIGDVYVNGNNDNSPN